LPEALSSAVELLMRILLHCHKSEIDGNNNPRMA